MRLTKNIINNAVATTVGEDVLPLVDYLKDRKNISEFKIAEKLGTEVNQTRNMLYRLHTHNLVSYHKKKDKQKGWYISYWSFNAKRIKDLMHFEKKKKIEQLKERLQKETQYKNSFYICPSMCSRFDFDKATEYDFKCPECGNVLNHQDNSRTIEQIQSKICQLEKEMNGKLCSR